MSLILAVFLPSCLLTLVSSLLVCRLTSALSRAAAMCRLGSSASNRYACSIVRTRVRVRLGCSACVAQSAVPLWSQKLALSVECAGCFAEAVHCGFAHCASGQSATVPHLIQFSAAHPASWCCSPFPHVRSVHAVP